MSTPGPPAQDSSTQRPKSAVGPLGIGTLLVLIGLLPRYLPVPLFEFGLILSLALPVGVVVIVIALRRMALGLETVYDRLGGIPRG